MSMKSQKTVKENKQQANRNKAKLIRSLLAMQNIKQVNIAKELGITPQAVSSAIDGKSTNSRVENWLISNLGIVF